MAYHSRKGDLLVKHFLKTLVLVENLKRHKIVIYMFKICDFGILHFCESIVVAPEKLNRIMLNYTELLANEKCKSIRALFFRILENF